MGVASGVSGSKPAELAGKTFGRGDRVAVEFGGEFRLAVVAAAIKHSHWNAVSDERA